MSLDYTLLNEPTKLLQRLADAEAQLERVRIQVKKLEEDGRHALLLLEDLQGINKALEEVKE